VRHHLQAVEPALAVGEEPKPALGAQPGVEQLQAPGGGVARVGERHLSPLGLQPVESCQLGLGQVDLAADLDPLRRQVGVTKPERNVADGADVVGDVVARLAVPARCCQNELPALVGQRH
jgi:hypothetical protein